MTTQSVDLFSKGFPWDMDFNKNRSKMGSCAANLTTTVTTDAFWIFVLWHGLGKNALSESLILKRRDSC